MNTKMKIKLSCVSIIAMLATSQALAMYDNDFDDSNPTSTPRNSQRSTREITEDLKKSIADTSALVEESTRRYPHANQVIIVGPTGNGKSTLMHHLADSPCEVRQTNGGLRVEALNPLPHIEIGHDPRSCTKIPHEWYDEDKNTLFWDCPGFGDTTGADQEIINIFAINKLFRANTNTKIVALTTESDMVEGERGSNFLKLIHYISDTFPNNPELRNSLSIVVNKQREANIREYIRSDILSRTQAEQAHLVPAVRNLLSHLANQHPERITWVKQANTVGRYNVDMQPIWRAIDSSRYMHNPVPTTHLSANANIRVNELAELLNKDIVSYIKHQGNTQIINYCKDRIKTHTGHVEGLRNYFKNLIDTLKNFRHTDIDLQNPRSFTQKLVTTFNGSFDVKEIQQVIDSLAFLKSMRPNVKYDMLEWIEALANDQTGHPISYIKQLTYTPNIHPAIATGILNLNGLIIGTSDIAKELQKAQQNNNKVNRVDVFSTNAFFLDQDITKLGCSFNIIAPYWIGVNGHRTIDISGDAGGKGEDGLHGTGSDGQPGEPGKPGENGGDFSGLGAHSYSLNKNGVKTQLDLSMNLNGGRGGIGGNGGKGANGSHGVDGCIQQPPRIDGDYRWQEERHGKTHRDVEFKGKAIFYEALGTDGQPGFDGGRGGCGGIGGYPGSFTHEGISFTGAPPSLSFGPNGGNGNPGGPGIGGKHGGNHHVREIWEVYCYSNHRYAPSGDHIPEGIWDWRRRHNRPAKAERDHLADRGNSVDGLLGYGLNDNDLQMPQPSDNTELKKVIKQTYNNYLASLKELSDYPQKKPFIEKIEREVKQEESSDEEEPETQTRPTPSAYPSPSGNEQDNARRNPSQQNTAQQPSVSPEDIRRARDGLRQQSARPQPTEAMPSTSSARGERQSSGIRKTTDSTFTTTTTTNTFPSNGRGHQSGSNPAPSSQRSDQESFESRRRKFEPNN